MGNEMDGMRNEFALAPRVTALVQQLRDVAPKVLDQEEAIRSLHAKLELLADGGAPTEGLGSSEHAALMDRLTSLEQHWSELLEQTQARLNEGHERLQNKFVNADKTGSTGAADESDDTLAGR